MANINEKIRRMLTCATIGLALSVSPCFAQENQSASQEKGELRRLQEAAKERLRRLQEAAKRAEEAREALRKAPGRQEAEVEATRAALLEVLRKLGRQPEPFKCDSALPEVCWDIYRRRMRERLMGVD